MRKLTYILFFLTSLQGITQEVADKEYYLIDGLILDELAEADKKLIDSCLKVYHKSNEDTVGLNAINVLIEQCWNEEVWPKYNDYLFQRVKTQLEHTSSEAEERALTIILGGCLNNSGYLKKLQGDYSGAIKDFTASWKIHEELKLMMGIATTLNNIGSIYNKQGDIPLALEYYHKSLKASEEIKDKNGVAVSLNNIGLIYKKQGDIELAITYYSKSLTILKEDNDKLGTAMVLNNIASIYDENGALDTALNYYSESLKIRQEINDVNGIAMSLSNIGYIYRLQGKHNQALENFNQSLAIRERSGDQHGITRSLYNIGYLELLKGNKAIAMKSLNRSLEISKEIGFPEGVRDASKLLSELYEENGSGTQALLMYKLHILMKDSVNNETTQKAAARQQAKYEYEKQKAIDDAEHDKLLAIEQEEKSKQRLLTVSTGIGLGLVIIFLLFVFNRLRVTKKQKLVIETQKQEVEQQKEVVELAHHEVEEKNREILDSITYAKRIQSAILPPAKVVKEYLQDSFILYKPKDIVAGDFYWMEHIDGKVLFAAADCTGHGVPGAMVSVVCNNALNRSVREHGLTDPGKILDKTREIVIQEFEKSDEEVKDGMDIALCLLNGTKLEYAGAHNPLWIIRKGELIETKANKQPIGQFDNPEPYLTHNFDLEQGDSIYIFSDGYVDQFGGEKGKKFKAKAFRELLLSVQDKSMEEQKVIINDNFELWKGNLEQVDDVCIIGIRI